MSSQTIPDNGNLPPGCRDVDTDPPRVYPTVTRTCGGCRATFKGYGQDAGIDAEDLLWKHAPDCAATMSEPRHKTCPDCGCKVKTPLLCLGRLELRCSGCGNTYSSYADVVAAWVAQLIIDSGDLDTKGAMP